MGNKDIEFVIERMYFLERFMLNISEIDHLKKCDEMKMKFVFNCICYICDEMKLNLYLCVYVIYVTLTVTPCHHGAWGRLILSVVVLVNLA